MKRNIRCLCVILGTLIAQSACSDVPKQYAAEAIEARVVDAETKKPLENVVVTANWQLEEGTLGGNRSAGQLMVMEAVTDMNGRFAFPAWGPEWVWKGFLVNEDPQLLLFKSGYEYRRLSNEYSSAPELRTRKVRRSDWNGKIIELKPFKGTQAEYAEHVYNLDNEMRFARYGNECEWKRIPRMLVEIHRLSKQFDSKGVKVRGWQIGARIRSVTDVDNQDRCGSPDEFFKSYLP